MESRQGKAIVDFFNMRHQLARRQVADAMAAHEATVQEINDQGARRDMLERAVAGMQRAENGMTRITLYERSRKVGMLLAQIVDSDVTRYELQLEADGLLDTALQHKMAAATHFKKHLKLGRWLLEQSRERASRTERLADRELQEDRPCRP